MASFKIKKLILKDRNTGTQVVGEIEVEGGKPITAVDSLPSATEENFEQGKIYTQGEILQYISKVALSEPTLSRVTTLVNAASEIASAAVGTDIYLFGGAGTNALNTIIKFSTTTETITTLSATLPVATYGMAAASVGTDIYLFGGYGGGARLNRIYKFSTTTGELTDVSVTLPSATNRMTAEAVGTDIYLFGGQVTSPLNTIYKFSTTTGTLTTLSSTLPTAAYSIASAVVGTDIYLFGGRGSSTTRLRTINKFSTTTGILTTLSAGLPVAMERIAAATIGTDIYLFGGATTSDERDTINKLSTTDGTLTTLSIKLPKTTYGIAAEAVGTDIYLFGGNDGSGAINTINKLSLGFTYEYEEIATKDDLENLGITVIEKTLGGQAPNLTIEDFTEEEFNTLLNDKSAIVVGTADSVSLLFSQQENINMSGLSMITFVCNAYGSGGAYLLGITKEDGTITAEIGSIESGTEIKSITISALETETQGTITSEQLATLQENDNNYIIFNDEIFRLNDKQHESGYLVYSHNGHDTTGCFFQKCITITISTLGWVLESQENASKTYVDEQITSAYGYNVRVDGETLVFETVGEALQGDY